VGIVIIDEEHEGSYKQDSAPRYHAREVAARIARERGCALVLWSATPSLESLGRCLEGSWGGASWTRVEMPERPGDAVLPKVHVVDMANQFAGGNRSVFSAPLSRALEGVASRREKAVLLLNRRGFANFLMCRECGCVPECPHCSTALTYHERTHSLACHTCGRSWPVRAYPDPSTRCPNCGSRYMGAYGVGTQRVEDELRMLLPDDVAIVRMDADTTKGKGDHQRLLEEFDAAECAVLVGTQMIAKGLDFPEVTVVGVINADTTLKMPDFRASERTYDLLEQVAGRAGRGERAGEVFIQTYWASHAAIRAVECHDRELFVSAELGERREGNYPPFSRLANVICWGKDAAGVRRVLDGIASAVRSSVEGRTGWEVLGPTDCLKARVKDRTRRHLLVKAPVGEELGPLLDACVRAQDKPRGVNVAIDVDAYDMM
jgi:primosomal protein N' (replication factor Y)